MKISLLAVMATILLSLGINANAALTSLDDNEMREADGRIFNSNNPEFEKQLLTKFTLKDKAAIQYVKEMNTLAVQIATGKVTEENFLEFYTAHLDRLFLMGVPEQVLNYQLNIVIRAQEQALRDQQLLEMQRAVFQRFVGELTRFTTEYRQNPNTPININLNYIFGSIPNVDLNMGNVGKDVLGGFIK